MWYKKETNGNWLVASQVKTPYNGELILLDNSNTQMELNGWFWSEEEPEEYTEWLNGQDNEEE